MNLQFDFHRCVDQREPRGNDLEACDIPPPTPLQLPATAHGLQPEPAIIFGAGRVGRLKACLRAGYWRVETPAGGGDPMPRGDFVKACGQAAAAAAAAAGGGCETDVAAEAVVWNERSGVRLVLLAGGGFVFLPEPPTAAADGDAPGPAAAAAVSALVVRVGRGAVRVPPLR